MYCFVLVKCYFFALFVFFIYQVTLGFIYQVTLGNLALFVSDVVSEYTDVNTFN